MILSMSKPTVSLILAVQYHRRPSAYQHALTYKPNLIYEAHSGRLIIKDCAPLKYQTSHDRKTGVSHTRSTRQTPSFFPLCCNRSYNSSLGKNAHEKIVRLRKGVGSNH
ncbi:hypothetical protein KC19_7G004000 [Ceratodon purpureus]|uniref:Uncharacterized protein n=1 Tax=Ceratodon purpureus TaxID=3225 RepID=A0A8T0H651_CERPU|nr:hypothetical protein KC19_7G004000 [Ceratodon purpureus]